MEWLQKRLHAAKESWEKIVLDEVFVFSGGLEGSWRRDDGWGITHRTKASTPGEDAHGEKARIGVLLEGERVVGLQLPCNGLVGVLSPSCGLLAKLRVLDLSGNSLKGTLDPICVLRSIEVVNLSSNILCGSISNAIGSLSTLQQLFLSDNKLAGPIPSSFSSLRELTVLCLDGNSLSGALPSNLAPLAKLRVLALQDNKLSGELPDLRELTALHTLDLSRNRFEGNSPSISMLSTLRVFACQGGARGKGGLSGGLKRLFSTGYSGSDMNLVRLDLSGHSLEGPLPTGLRGLRLLEVIILSGNKLSGTLPQWLGELERLRHVDLSANLLEGPVPTALAELPYLEALLLQQNALEGELPPKAATALCSGKIRRFSLDGSGMEIVRRPTIVGAYESPSARRGRRGTYQQFAETARDSLVPQGQSKIDREKGMECSILLADTVPINSDEASTVAAHKGGRRGTDVL